MGFISTQFRSRHARRAGEAGGKGCGIARLHRAGFDVPRGFLIGTRVFDDVVSTLGIERDLCSPDIDTATLQRLYHSLQHGTIRPAWKSRILSEYRKLANPVAVRSSMVGEDTARTSLAGQLETVLDVSGEERFLAAIQQCYASLCNARLHRYLREMNERTGQAGPARYSLALVVQEMVPARAAGVAFSADPDTGEPCVIIEGNPGRTDGVTSGRIEPARWVVNARGVLEEARCADEAAVPMGESEILQLAGLVRKIAAHMGGPQDIEWVWDGARFWFLQARPVTTLAGKHIYSSRLVADMSPGLVKHLVWSTNTISKAENVFGRIFTELIGPNTIDFSKLSRRIHSRIYTDMTMLGELMERIGLPANFFGMMARDETGERPPLNISIMRILRNGRLPLFLLQYIRDCAAIGSFLELQHFRLEPYRRSDPGRETLRTLMEKAEELMRLHSVSQWYVFLAAITMMIRKRQLDRFLRRHAPQVTSAELLSGVTGLKSLEPNRLLRDMAASAKKLDTETFAILSSGCDAEVRRRLASSECGRALLAQADLFLDRLGFLSANGTDFSTESWVESPTLVWRTIARMGSGEADTVANGASTGGEKARGRVGRAVGPFRRRRFRRVFDETVKFMRLRERASLLLSEDAYQIRRIFLAMGARLADRGALESAEDIFYLYIEEVRDLVGETLDDKTAQRLVSQRREEMRADALIDPPDILCGDCMPAPADIRLDNREYLVGIGGSAGMAEGRTLVVRDPVEAPAMLGKDDILVVPFTDVGWTPLFAGIGGIIAETGGQLSHTSIVAREYNLPAVVSVRNAIRLLGDGQRVVLDGHQGRVYIGNHGGE